VQPVNISRASIRQVMALALRTGLFGRIIMKIGEHNGPKCLTRSEVAPPMQILSLKLNVNAYINECLSKNNFK
jgi:hypothetical protein